MEHINIEQFSDGELSQQINREVEAVANNIADPNTDSRVARKITVTITMKPNDKRDFITTSITTKSTLAPTMGAVTALCVGKNLKTGKVEVAEIGNQIPGQMSMEETNRGKTEPLVEVDGKTVDTETGEVLEQDNANIVDLRKVSRQA